MGCDLASSVEKLHLSSYTGSKTSVIMLTCMNKQNRYQLELTSALERHSRGQS